MKLDRLPILILYPHSRCNCRCTMCDIWRRTEAQELTPANIEGWLDDLRKLQVEQVVFSGGEPLMHSNLGALAEPLLAIGAKLTLLTTGLLLGENAALVNDLFDEVIVSLDGPREIHDAIRRVPGAFDRVAAGVQAIQTPSHGRCTVQKANHTALRATTEAARELGLESISFLAVDVGSAAFDHTATRQRAVGLEHDEVTTLSEEVETLIAREAARGYVRESPEKLRAIVKRFRARLGLETAEAPPCTAPWVSAVIETDGKLRPCFFHESVANALDDSLDQSLNSDVSISFRQNLNVSSNPVCRRCVCSLNRPI